MNTAAAATPSLKLVPLTSDLVGLKKAILITNSDMPAALGDAVASLPALLKYLNWAKTSKIVDCVAWTCPQMPNLFDLPLPQLTLTSAIELGVAIEVRVDTQEIIRQNWSDEKSLVEMYGRGIGELVSPPFDWPEANAEECSYLVQRVGGNAFALLAPFSISDRGTGTKTWPLWKWIDLANRLSEVGVQPVLVGHSVVAAEAFHQACPIKLISLPMSQIAWAMQNAAFTVTVDNGMGWLAQSLEVRHIQILSSNMPSAFAFDNGRNAYNINTCATASIGKVWTAIKEIQNNV